ncbi:hypothetical protein CLV62_1127 [Dysgonomonas alginatilytica]|uniref:Toxin VasX N-terminal region domain-containing protein n=1 Tax=Dysgonomonas alginatilytica TaxID=1605892 RepID=A0A2V3PN41_9BACT|nr:toxin VasX [Dysgonomonas alginatilytica]PXV63758.1 hypothetical protein CLV62_1127 [Dysgonomonas alginatilytica]
MGKDPLTKKYKFSATNYDGREVESDRLSTTDGIILRFNRYSLHQAKTDEQYQNFNLNPNFPDKVGIYEYCRKNIVEGYIYMYNEKFKDIIEFRCIAGILIQGPRIKWDKEASDFREIEPYGDYKDYTIIKKGIVYWFAYSTEQWSVRYTRSMIDDQKLREKRFQELDTSYLTKNKDVATYEDILIYHEKNNPSEYERIAYDKFELGLSSIKPLDDKTPYVYFSLHDPIGCATDLRKDQLIALGDLSQLVNSISVNTKTSNKYTNEDFHYLHLHALTFYKMFYGRSSGSSETDKTLDVLKEKIVEQEFLEKILLVERRGEARIHANNIRRTMLTFADTDYYRAALDDFKNNHPIHMERGIERVVEHHKGISMDANLVDRHIDIKDTSCDFNKDVTKYMQESASIGHKVDELLSQKYDLEDILFIEGNKPTNVDDVVSTTDIIWSNMTNAGIAWNGHLTQITKSEDAARTAAQTMADEAAEIAKEAQKIAQAAAKASEGVKDGVQLATTSKGTYLIIEERWFNKVSISERTLKGPRGGTKKINCWVFDQITMDELLKDVHCIQKTDYIKRGGRAAKRKVGIPIRRIADTEGKILGGYRKHVVIEAIIDKVAKAAAADEAAKTAAVATAAEANKTAAAKAAAAMPSHANLQRIVETIFKSKSFMGLTSCISAWNLSSAISNIDNNSIPYNFFSIFGATAELGQFVASYVSLFSKIPKHMVQSLNFYSNIFGIASCTALGIVNVIDGISAFRQNNTKAGLAYIGSAVGFFAAAGISAGLMLQTPPVWARNKYLIIAYLVSIGLMLLAIYLTHTPLEQFLANYILQKDAIKKVNGWKRMEAPQIMQTLCENKADIIGDDFPKWHTLKQSLECFTLLLMNMKVTPKHEIVKVHGSLWNRIINSYTTTYKLNNIFVACSYNTLTFDSDVEYGLRIFYKKPSDDGSRLHCKDIEGDFSELSNGCRISYSRSYIDSCISYTYRIHSAYFFQRVIYKDGSCFPPVNEKGEDIYFMERVDVDTSYSNMDSGSSYMGKTVQDIMEISGSENRAPFSFDKLHEIVKRKLSSKREGNKEIILETNHFNY